MKIEKRIVIKLLLKLDCRSWSSHVHLICSVVISMDVLRVVLCSRAVGCVLIFLGENPNVVMSRREGEGRVWLRMTPRENEPRSRPWPFAKQTCVQLCRARDAAAALWVLNLQRMKSDVGQKGILAIVIFVPMLMLVIDSVGSTGAQTTGDNSPRCSGVIMLYCVFLCFLCVFLCLLQHKLPNWDK